MCLGRHGRFLVQTDFPERFENGPEPQRPAVSNASRAQALTASPQPEAQACCTEQEQYGCAHEKASGAVRTRWLEGQPVFTLASSQQKHQKL